MIHFNNKPSLKLPEGLYWNPETLIFGFVDILTGCYYEFDLTNGFISKKKTFNDRVGWVYPHSNNQTYICGLSNSIVEWNSCTDDLVKVCDLDIKDGQRINDGFVTPDGEIFFGVTSSGVDYRDKNGALYQALTSLLCSVNLAGLVNKHYHRLIGAKDVDAPSKLRGKVIGLPFFGGPQDMAARVALAGVGLDADKDVSLKAMGAEYARLTALVRGDVAAVTVAAPDSLIAAQGLHVLVDLPALDLPFPYMQLVVRRSVLDAEPAKVDRTLHALCDAIEFYRSHPDESLVHLADELGDKKGPAREAYDAMGPTHLSWPPVPNTEALTAVVEFLAQDDEAYVGVNAAEIVDLGPLGRVQAKGGCGGPPHS